MLTLEPLVPHPDKPPAVPFGAFRVRFGPFRVRLGPFGSISGLFRVRFGSVGWGRGGVGERGICKGKEYHYACGIPDRLWKSPGELCLISVRSPQYSLDPLLTTGSGRASISH